jgi:hypothetical protein
MEWEEIEGASSYELELWSADRKRLVQKKQVKSAKLEGRVLPGQYLYRIRALDRRRVAGPWSEFTELEVFLERPSWQSPASHSILKSSSLDEERVSLRWQAVWGADEYELHIHSLTGGSEMATKTVKPEWEGRLQVGHIYRARLLARSESRSVTSDPENPELEFTLIGGQLASAQIEIPDTEYIRQLRWDCSRPAQATSLKIFRITALNGQKKIEKIKDEVLTDFVTEIPLSWPGGAYQIQLVCQAPRFNDSSLVAKNFKLLEGDRSEQAQYIAELRRSIDAFRGWYFQLSHIMTELDYQFSRPILGGEAAVSFRTLTGTGRLSLGYLPEEKRWGAYTWAEYGGFFNQENKVVNFAGLEAGALYRTRLSDRDDLRVRAGLFYKQVPLAEVDLNENIVSQYRLGYLLGPALTTEYWWSFSSYWGVQVQASLSWGLLNENAFFSSPTAGHIVQGGAFVFYRWRKTRALAMGMTQRQEQLRWDWPGLGGQAEFAMRGAYLHFLYEQAF